MKRKTTWLDLHSEIVGAFQELKNKPGKDKSKTLVAAFDADGTLWPHDLGENFFKYQIQKKLLPNLPKDPWVFYRNWKTSGNPRPAYTWLAQINAGFDLEVVRSWSQAAYQETPQPKFFSQQKMLIDSLHGLGVQVYVVTASVKWGVEPGAMALGIPEHRVIGVETKIKGGKVTREPLGPVTYRHGKIEKLLQVTKGVAPVFVSGNSEGDLDLLHAASSLRLAVCSADRKHELYKTEQKLQKIAGKLGWLRFSFIEDR